MLDQVKTDIDSLMAEIGRNARAAARPLAIATTDEKNRALEAMAAEILAHREAILAANAIDLAHAKESGVAASFIDRLTLTPERIEGIAGAIRDIAALKDPVGDGHDIHRCPHQILRQTNARSRLRHRARRR